MKQRLAIASTLLGNPDILVFDEPTNGLDPAGIAEIRQLMIDLNRQGKTVIMASHILDEVEKVCTHVAILQKGGLKTVGTVHDVLHESTAGTVNILEVELATENSSDLEAILKNLPGVVHIQNNNGTLTLQCEDSSTTAAINKYCFEKGIVLSQLNLKRKTLEKRFLEDHGNKKRTLNLKQDYV